MLKVTGNKTLDANTVKAKGLRVFQCMSCSQIIILGANEFLVTHDCSHENNGVSKK